MGKRILKSQIEGETYHGKGGAVIRLYRGQIRVWYPSKKEAWKAAKQYNSMDLDLIDGKQIAEVLRRLKSIPGDWHKEDQECEECGGMGHTIGFLGKTKQKYPCETC